jgi:hypothetical protein
VARLGGRGERDGGRLDAERVRGRGRHGRADGVEQGSVRHGRAAYLTLAGLIAALLLVAAGCGGDGDDPPAASAPGPTRLTVTEHDGERVARTIRLDCGTEDVACAEVVALLPRLRPDPGEVCTQVYGGPERITVTGTVDGAPVDVRVPRVDGCQIARYDLLTRALAAG